MCCRENCVDAVVKGEYCVLRRELTGARHYYLVEECHILGAHHLVVAVYIAQGKYVVVARRHVAQRELAAAVGTAHA